VISSYGSGYLHGPNAHVGVEHEHASAGLVELRLDPMAVAGFPEKVDLAELGVGAHAQRNIVGDDHL